MTGNARLRPKQTAAIAALLDGCNYGEAADRAGINEATLRRWRRDDEGFQQALSEARQGVLDEIANRAVAYAGDALDELHRLATTPASPSVLPASVRGTAAYRILEVAHRWTIDAELERRIRRLEQHPDQLTLLEAEKILDAEIERLQQMEAAK